MSKFIVTLLVVTLVAFFAYKTGKQDGCDDLIHRLNNFGYNKAAEGIGLSDWAWCHE